MESDRCRVLLFSMGGQTSGFFASATFSSLSYQIPGKYPIADHQMFNTVQMKSHTQRAAIQIKSLNLEIVSTIYIIILCSSKPKHSQMNISYATSITSIFKNHMLAMAVHR